MRWLGTINPGQITGHSDMWVSKPIYESLPYFYLLVGAVSLAASMYLNHWYWPTICFVVGLGSLVAGLVVWLKRRDHRDPTSRSSQNHDL
jgi:hypothetical protein